MSHVINETLFSPKHPSILFFYEKKMKKTRNKKTIADIGKTAAALACNFSPSKIAEIFIPGASRCHNRSSKIPRIARHYCADNSFRGGALFVPHHAERSQYLRREITKIAARVQCTRWLSREPRIFLPKKRHVLASLFHLRMISTLLKVFFDKNIAYRSSCLNSLHGNASIYKD